ncbi:hypothetical protein GYMLUDRAFT_110585, partial [Collybiopsis luxurians FD-317 M1]
QEILQLVKIGLGLSEDQRKWVEGLLASYTDCFALSVSKVCPVPGAMHQLHIPDGAKFSMKVRQKALIPLQCKYLHTKVDKLVAASVIEWCSPNQVKCV